MMAGSQVRREHPPSPVGIELRARDAKLLLRRLRYFAMVADEGGISRAATRLHVAQPALTRQIHDLERTVGRTLFERDHRGVRLTSAGVRLRDDVDRLFPKLDDALRRVRLAHDGKVATFRLGLSRAALMDRRISRLVTAFHEQFPYVNLDVSEADVMSQAQSLMAGDIDACICLGADAAPGIATVTLFEEELDCAMFASSHPLAQAGPIDPEELANVTLRLDVLSLPRFPALRRGLDQLGFTWTGLQGVDTVFSYVATGDGWTITTRAASIHPPSGFSARRIRGLDVHVPMLLRWRRQDDLPVLRNLLAVAAHELAEERSPIARANAAPALDGPRPSPLDVHLHQLIALVTSLSEGSLSAAAERLRLTQSAISRQIRGLERAVGVPLIARAGGRLVPTAAGAVLREDAVAIIELADHALERARRGAGTAGHCAIGTMPNELTNGLLLESLKRLTAHCPDVTFTVVEGRARAALLHRQIDVAIAALFRGSDEDPDVAALPLQDDPLDCVLIAASHPLAAKPVLLLEDLAGEPFLFIKRALAPVAYDLVIQSIRQLGITSRLGAEYNGARVLWGAVASGAGWAIGSRSLCSAPPSGVVARPLEGLSVPWGIGLLWRRDETDPVVLRVVEVIQSLAEASEEAAAVTA